MPGDGARRTTGENDAPRLAAEKRQVTEERILRAAMVVMAQRGFSATVEEIAAVAGVSGRTIYRYFDSHDQLIALGYREMLNAVGAIIPDLPSVNDDLDGWIDAVAFTSHARNSMIIGAAFWDVFKPAPSSSEEIEAIRAARRPMRMQWMTAIASVVWMAGGGPGEPPTSMVETIALALSSFTTHALAADFDYSPEETARFAACMIKDRLSAALERETESSHTA
jgi:AcrR family transcriptional regulator